MAFASHLCPRFPPHFFWKQQIYANPFFWFFTFSVILADLHSDTEKKASPSCGVKNVRSVPRILGQNNGNYDQKINGPLNSRTYTQSHTPTVVQGRGVDGTPLLGF